MFKEYQNFDAIGLNELIRSKDVSAEEVLEAAIARCEAINPDINAVIHKMYEQAHDQLTQADVHAPLYGVPFLLKDLSIHYAGVPTTYGSRFFKDYIPHHDSELVRRYKKAGLMIMGKTNTPELGTNWVTESVLFGPCRNPHDLSKTPGGSSGGSGAAVAAGIVPAAHASDAGGSIRVPASCCGLIGLKPTRARVPVGPDRGEGCSGLTVQHALTRSVRDCALLLDIAKGAEIGDPYMAPQAPESYLQAMQAPLPKQLKIGLVTKAPGDYPVAKECLQAVQKALNICEELGAVIEETEFVFDWETLRFATNVIWTGNIAANLERYAKAIGRDYTDADIEPTNLFMANLGNKLKAKDYAHALDVIHQTGRQMAQMMQHYDLLLTPTLAKLPLAIGELFYEPHKGSINDFYKDRGFAFSPFTSLFNISGQPAISLPLHTSASGLPVGVQFASAFGNELLLLQLAQVISHDSPHFS